MIYQPVNAYPNNTAVDVLNTDGKHPLYFEWQFHGNYMTHGSIFIYDMNNMDADAIELPYTFKTPIYGDDMVKIAWNEELAKPNLSSNKKLKNGTEYLWQVVQYEDEPTMFVKHGKVQKASTNTNIILQNDMHLWFNNNTECYLIINGEKKRITNICKVGDITKDVERNDKEMQVIVAHPFTFVPQEGYTYSIYTAGSATINGFYFKARTTPEIAVEFTNPESDLNEQGKLQYRLSDFKGTYTQEQGIPIKYHYWQLYRILDRNKDLITQTKDTYNSRLEFYFDGFVSNETYELYLNIVTQDGQYISNNGLRFQVEYNKPIMGNDLVSLSWNPDHNTARISMKDIQFSRPTLSPDCKYEFQGDDKGILHVIDGTIDYTHIAKEELQIRAANKELQLRGFTLFSEFSMSVRKVGPIISLLFDPINDILRDSFYISIDERVDDESQPTGTKDFRLHLIKNGIDSIDKDEGLYFSTKVGKKPCFQDSRTAMNDQSWEYVWPIEPIELDTFNSNAQFFIMNDSGSLSDTFKLVLTPNKVYLRAVNAQKDYPVIDVDIGDTIYHCLRLYKDVFYNYNILLERTATETEINQFLHNDNFIPAYNTFKDTLLYTPFTNSSLSSSKLEGVDAEKLKGYLIYREKVGEGIKHRVGILDLDTQYIEDFMVTNDNIYKWELIPISDQEYGISIETQELMVRFDEWTIATYEPDSEQDDVYYVDKDSIWKFGLNIEGHDIEQNIMKQKIEGLSQYPKYAIQKRNYITGGLTAYLANMTNNDVYNTVAIQNRFPVYSPYRVASDIYWEPSDKLIEWNKLVASGKEVIIRDIKGHMWRAQIDSNNAVIDIYAQTSPTTIEFSFTEVGSVDNCSVYLKE